MGTIDEMFRACGFLDDSSWSSDDDSSKKSLFRVIMENFDTLFVAENFDIFTPWEVLEPEYLKNKKR